MFGFEDEGLGEIGWGVPVVIRGLRIRFGQWFGLGFEGSGVYDGFRCLFWGVVISCETLFFVFKDFRVDHGRFATFGVSSWAFCDF